MSSDTISVNPRIPEPEPLERNGLSEDSPLLKQDDDAARRSKRQWRSWQTPIVIISMLIVIATLVTAGDQLTEYSRPRIYEAILCFKYYEKVDPSRLHFGRDQAGPGAIDGVDELLCKINPVQDELAVLVGYQRFFDGIPSLLMTIPFGWGADRIGRRPFLLAGLTTYFLRNMWTQLVPWFWKAMPLRTVWISAAFNLVGGGDAFVTALFFVIITDVTNEGQRANTFFAAAAAMMLAMLTMPLLSAWLMQLDPWIPYLLGTVTQIVAFFVAFAVPETLPQQYEEEDHHANVVSYEEGDRTRRTIRSIRSSVAFLLNDWRVPLLMTSHLVRIVPISSAALILQYLSKRYELTFASATLLLSTRNGLIIVILLTVLPMLSHHLTRKGGLTVQQKDVYLARASQLCSAVGWILVAFAPDVVTVAGGLLITALGIATYLCTQSLIASLVSKAEIAKAYSTISLVDTVGSMLCGPVMAELFKVGLRLGGVWVGLPYFFLGGLCGLFCISYFFVHPDCV